MFDLYQSFNETTKRVLRNSFVEIGKKKKDNIHIDPSTFECVFAQIINNFETNTICNNFGSNSYSFDNLILRDNVNISVSLKTRNFGALYSKVYEMPISKEDKIIINKRGIEGVRIILDMNNNRVRSENKKFNIFERRTLYFEKSGNFVRVLEGIQEEILIEDITNVKFEDKSIKFIYKEEQFLFNLNNCTLYQTRKNYKLVDVYEYKDFEIMTEEELIYDFIMKQKDILFTNHKCLSNVIDITKKRKEQTFIMTDKNTINETQLKQILNCKATCSKNNMYFVKITPSLARYLLENHQTTNRTLKRKKVDEYKNYIANGKWNERTGISIGFDESGNITDGQHRLHAISELDECFFLETWVNTGTVRSEHKDTGVKRSTYDNVLYMGICPEKCLPYYTDKVNSALMFYCHFFGEGMRDSIDAQHSFLTYFFENHSNLLIDFMSPWQENGKDKSVSSCSLLLKKPVLAALFNAYATSIINKEDIKYIVYVLQYGLTPNQTATPPQLMGLRDYLTKGYNEKKKRLDSSDGLHADMFKITTSFIKGYKNGKSTNKITKTKDFPAIFNFGGMVTKHVIDDKKNKAKIIA